MDKNIRKFRWSAEQSLKGWNAAKKEMCFLSMRVCLLGVKDWCFKLSGKNGPALREAKKCDRTVLLGVPELLLLTIPAKLSFHLRAASWPVKENYSIAVEPDTEGGPLTVRTEHYFSNHRCSFTRTTTHAVASVSQTLASWEWGFWFMWKKLLNFLRS